MRMLKGRSAIAMIELIFAIVVMGIALMSAPSLIRTAKQGTTAVLQQEGINQAVSRIVMIFSYPWDENDTNVSCIPPVLRVTHGDSELEPMPTDSSRRIGVPSLSNSRKFTSCGSALYASSTLGMDPGDSQPDDIDDFTNTTLQQIQNAGGRYIEKSTVSIATTVSYGSDNADYTQQVIHFAPGSGQATSNIKNIQVTVTSTSGTQELQKTITMHAFSCNIGGIEYAKKSF